MLVNLKEILKIAEDKKIAIGAFNTPNFESLDAVIAAAEALSSPVIIMHAQLHEEMGLCTIEDIAPLMIFMAMRSSVPVCVHLDHGTDIDYVKRGLALGFTSVMYDGSEGSFEMNCANTKTIVEEAAKYGASVEAEVGNMGTREGGGQDGSSIYTDPDLAAEFVSKTGVDALACAFGTAHGFYLAEPKLDFDRVCEIRSKMSVPIVMHGGSGISDEDCKRVIECGVRKINYYTYMAKAGGDAVANLTDKTFYHDMAVAARKAMFEDVKKVIQLYMCR